MAFSGQALGIRFGPGDGQQSRCPRWAVFPRAVGRNLWLGLRAARPGGSRLVRLRHLPSPTRHRPPVAMRGSWRLGVGPWGDGRGALERAVSGLGSSAPGAGTARGWCDPLDLGHGLGLADWLGRRCGRWVHAVGNTACLCHQWPTHCTDRCFAGAGVSCAGLESCPVRWLVLAADLVLRRSDRMATLGRPFGRDDFGRGGDVDAGTSR